jgi:uncharacterized protein YjdB
MSRASLINILVLSVLVVFGALACSNGSTTNDPDGDVVADGDGPDAAMPYVVVSGDVALLQGETLTLSAQTVNGTDAAYTWASEDEAVATVDEDGVVTGVALGSAVITATGDDTGKTGSWGVYVYTDTVPANAAVVVSGDVAVQIGSSATLTATTVDGEDGSYVWTSSSDAVATVSEAGVVTGVSVGEVVITATGADSGKSGNWGMYVYAAPVTIPVVTVTGAYSVEVGKTLQLAASTAEGTDSGYTWSSSDESLATVDETGLVTGVAGGNVVITATGADTNVEGTIGIAVLDAAGPDAPFVEMWSTSAHADATAEAFVHWDADGEVPTSCAKCHSTPGFADFLGADGSAAGTVDVAAPIGTVVSCVACHNGATLDKSDVTFPSGEMVAGLGMESVCMECHQGRESSVSVNAAIDAAAPADDDTPAEGLGFKNIHYMAAGATQFGAQAKGAYEYVGKSYDPQFQHVDGVATCITCHDPHTLQVKEDTCSQCHTDGEDYKEIRMLGSLHDYDGNGDNTEGIYYEIQGLKEKLYEAIQAYALEVADSGIVYDESAYPYFFIDTNENGQVDDGEATNANKFTAWTARLVKATYNFQFVNKDKGGYAHNAKYLVQILFDSIADLNSALTTPVDMASAVRDDAGHFMGTEEAWRHWDEDGEVSTSCARCHSAVGLPEYLKYGQIVDPVPVSNGLACATCHDDLSTFSQRIVDDVTFPSGEVIDSENNTTNMCMTCHQGRESMVSIDAVIAGKPLDTVDAAIKFKNIHYFAAGATRYGKLAKAAYMYEGKYYDGLFAHAEGYTECSNCHSVHTQEVKVDDCATCHLGVESVEDLADIRMPASIPDYDGDGNVTEGIKGEIDGLLALAYSAMQAYAVDNAEADPIKYDPNKYPYFLNADTDAGYATWTPRLLKAAFNYQLVQKDPGNFAHNPKFIIEVLYDTIEDLGGDVSSLHRNDEGHFDSTAEAFRHWDEDGEVQASCARCHSSEGFKEYATTGTNPVEAKPFDDGFDCQTCHEGFSVQDEELTAPIRYVGKVTFPSGIELNNDVGDPKDAFVCFGCHTGRESMATIDASIASNSFKFKNVHYLPATSILYGTDAQVGYEYEDKTYATKWTHTGQDESTDCFYCHKANGEEHSFEVSCVGCHGTVTPENAGAIRHSNLSGDYNGNGNNTEPLATEVSVLSDALLAAIQNYALNTLGAAILYDANAYPYFLKGDASGGYANWDAKLMKAAHNLHISHKEPGAWAHNTRYMIQLLIDSIEDMGGDIGDYTRP